MKRREFIALIGGAAAWPLAARAQQPGKIPVIGCLWHAANQAEEAPFFDWVREGFTQLGFVPGRNIRIEDRYPAEVPERFDSMAAELVQMNVDVIVCVGLAASFAARACAMNTDAAFHRNLCSTKCREWPIASVGAVQRYVRC
jgi:putative tryptophan/tyrosine transport system substrate-binding protein